MKVAILGYGKMGKIIEEVLLEKGHEIVIKADNDSFLNEQLAQADVAIEFTQPDAAVANIMRCLHANVPVVVGTTGWYEEMEKIVDTVDELNGTVFYTTNFSLGVNIFFAVNRYLAKLMHDHPNYEIHLEETHHTEKVDSPSGTAITIAEQILDKIERKGKWVNETTTGSDLGIKSMRVQGVPGTHSVRYESDIDEIEIIHTAKSRMGFAHGAVLAAEWVQGRKGLFTMTDLMKAYD